MWPFNVKHKPIIHDLNFNDSLANSTDFFLNENIEFVTRCKFSAFNSPNKQISSLNKQSRLLTTRLERNRAAVIIKLFRPLPMHAGPSFRSS